MKIDTMSTGQMLDFLSTFGRPRVSRLDDGKWCASVKFPAPVGVTAEVTSDYSHPTHESALIQVIARVQGLTIVTDKVSRALASIEPKVITIR